MKHDDVLLIVVLIFACVGVLSTGVWTIDRVVQFRKGCVCQELREKCLDN